MIDKFERLRDLEYLKSRFENNFPLIYIGDKVIGNSRWAGENKKNPLEGKEGVVIGIQHGFQSVFNRDYLILTMIGEDKRSYRAWLYTLDLKMKHEDNHGLMKSGGMVYIDDRIQITDKNHYRLGRIGNVRAIFGNSKRNKLIYEVRDEKVMKQFHEINDEISNKIDEELTKKLPDFEHSSYAQLFKEEVMKDLFEEQEVKELEEFLKYLEENSRFLVKSSSVELIERFPPNTLFKE